MGIHEHSLYQGEWCHVMMLQSAVDFLFLWDNHENPDVSTVSTDVQLWSEPLQQH